MTRTARVAVVLLAALLVAAADPSGDVGPCPPGSAGSGDRRIDIVGARAEIIESGTALRFTIEFARAFEAPDGEGTPLRVDVVLRDPGVPTVTFHYYRALNRIVRFDAVPDPALQIVLLPEQGANVFVGAVAIGDTLTMTLPGRLVTRDADLEGLGLERLRWGVVARDEDDCDALGDGTPTFRLIEEGSTATPTPGAVPSTSTPSPPTSSASLSAGGSSPEGSPSPERPAWTGGWLLGAAVIAGAWGASLVVRRRRRRPAR